MLFFRSTRLPICSLTRLAMPAELSHIALFNTNISSLLGAEPGPAARGDSGYFGCRVRPAMSWLLTLKP